MVLIQNIMTTIKTDYSNIDIMTLTNCAIRNIFSNVDTAHQTFLM